MNESNDSLFSTVSGKPCLRCFTGMFTVGAISNARDYRESTVLTVFGRQEGFGFMNGCKKTVLGMWTSCVKGPTACFSLSSWHENITDDFGECLYS